MEKTLLYLKKIKKQKLSFFDILIFLQYSKISLQQHYIFYSEKIYKQQIILMIEELQRKKPK